MGEATARRYAKSGANVIVADTNISGGEKTAEIIRMEGGTSEFVQTDVTSESDVINLMNMVNGMSPCCHFNLSPSSILFSHSR